MSARNSNSILHCINNWFENIYFSKSELVIEGRKKKENSVESKFFILFALEVWPSVLMVKMPSPPPAQLQFDCQQWTTTSKSTTNSYCGFLTSSLINSTDFGQRNHWNNGWSAERTSTGSQEPGARSQEPGLDYSTAGVSQYFSCPRTWPGVVLDQSWRASN